MYVVGLGLMYVHEGLLTMFLFQNQVNSTVCVSLLIVLYMFKSQLSKGHYILLHQVFSW